MPKEHETSKTISPVILNSTNLISNGGLNNIYRYAIPGSGLFRDAEIAISNIQMFYSWQNITSTYDNNTFSIIFPTGAGTATVNLTVPDGTYTVADLNSYIQSIMVANNYYLIDGGGDFVYYLELVENASRYAIQLNTFPVPTALPAGWTNPGWALPVVGNTPQLVVPSTAIQTLLGFTAGTYPSPAQATAYSALSTSVPQLSPVSSVIVGCNLVNNQLANPRSVIYSFSPGGTTYGNLIQSSAYQYSWVPIQNGTYSSVDITFYDQNFNNLRILDTNVVIFLLIRS